MPYPMRYTAERGHRKMTELTFEELGTARDAVRSAIRENEHSIYVAYSLRFKAHCAERHARAEEYEEVLSELDGVARKLHRLSEKLTDMLKELQPE